MSEPKGRTGNVRGRRMLRPGHAVKVASGGTITVRAPSEAASHGEVIHCAAVATGETGYRALCGLINLGTLSAATGAFVLDLPQGHAVALEALAAQVAVNCPDCRFKMLRQAPAPNAFYVAEVGPGN